MAAFFFVVLKAGWHYGQSVTPTDPLYLQATTACLSAIVVLQIVNVFLCRSPTASIFSTGIRGNLLIAWGVIVEIAVVLAIDYTPLGNLIFGTAPLQAKVWLFVIPFALGMLLLEELRKSLVRRLSVNA